MFLVLSSSWGIIWGQSWVSSTMALPLCEAHQISYIFETYLLYGCYLISSSLLFSDLTVWNRFLCTWNIFVLYISLVNSCLCCASLWFQFLFEFCRLEPAGCLLELSKEFSFLLFQPLVFCGNLSFTKKCSFWWVLVIWLLHPVNLFQLWELLIIDKILIK